MEFTSKLNDGGPKYSTFLLYHAATEFEASPLGSTGGNNPHLERLEHLVALSKALNAFFQRQMEKVTDAVNEALNPQSLGLAADDFGLPFNDNLRANNGKRVALSFGPIKRADRALKKAHEYGEFLFITICNRE